MKKLIVYTSKTGTTEKCVNLIKDKVKDIDIINLDKETVDLNNYNFIIIGTPIRMGMINKRIKKFIDSNLNILLTKKTAMFICCGFNDNWENYYEQINKRLLDSFIIYTSFGGEMLLEKQKGFDRLITKMVMKKEDGKREVKLIQKEIKKFIEIVNK